MQGLGIGSKLLSIHAKENRQQSAALQKRNAEIIVRAHLDAVIKHARQGGVRLLRGVVLPEVLIGNRRLLVEPAQGAKINTPGSTTSLRAVERAFGPGSRTVKRWTKKGSLLPTRGATAVGAAPGVCLRGALCGPWAGASVAFAGARHGEAPVAAPGLLPVPLRADGAGAAGAPAHVPCASR